MFQVIDMHCDTIPALQWKEKQEHLADADLQINLDKLEKGGSLCQCFSLFTFLKGLKDETPFEHVRKLADLWKSEVERYPDRICQIKTYADLMQVQKEGKIGAVMTVEEGGVYEGSIEKLHTLYDLGVRISTLTWNFPNELGFPNPAQEEGKPYLPDLENGLTPTGITFVEEMERLGIVIDLSHLNDAGIRDVFAHTRGPVIASHSNARGACFHLRNLSDEMIRQLAERGGVTGINFCPSFLREEEPATKKASTMDMVRHMKYLRNVGGIDIIGLGTDFDGFSGETDVPDTAHMQHLADVMSTTVSPMRRSRRSFPRMYFGCLENAGNKTTAPVMPPEAPLYNHSADAQTVLPSPRSPQSGLLSSREPGRTSDRSR